MKHQQPEQWSDVGDNESPCCHELCLTGIRKLPGRGVERDPEEHEGDALEEHTPYAPSPGDFLELAIAGLGSLAHLLGIRDLE